MFFPNFFSNLFFFVRYVCRKMPFSAFPYCIFRLEYSRFMQWFPKRGGKNVRYRKNDEHFGFYIKPVFYHCFCSAVYAVAYWTHIMVL